MDREASAGDRTGPFAGDIHRLWIGRKGRALLVAAGYPVKEIIGVEFIASCMIISLRNIARFPKSAMCAGGIRSVCEDASGSDLL